MDFIDESYSHYDENGRALIRSAYSIANEALAGQMRDNQRPFIEHPCNVGLIVSDEMGLPAVCVAAVFLHEASSRGDYQIDWSAFPEDVVTMVDGLNKIATIKPKDTRLEAENYKKLIVQYSKDPRVTVLKIADRLEVMRNLEMFPRASRERKVLETLMLYIPLAHQLGLYNIKSELENIYFRFAEPEQYRAITNKLKATEKDRIKISNEFVEPLKKTLSDAGIKYKFKIRTKTAYSIYKKMCKQGVPFEGVYDVYALRFIIECDSSDHKTEKDLCWQVYSYVTAEYEPDTKRLRDWITNPKPNGYESLHITVRNRDNSYIEVQIRTHRMDDEAENGHASHWSYKGIRHEETMDKWLTSVRYALEHPDQSNPDDLPQPPSKEIFVFTPTGELRILPAGACMLDFAYGIHSNLGNKCTGGKVNGKVVSIREKLKTGDVVEIMSGKNQKPAPDWINYVVTSKAKSKIRQALNEEEYKKSLAGRELMSRRLKNWKLELHDDLVAEFMKKNKIPTVTGFYAMIGDGTLDINDVKTYILEHDAMVAQALEAAKAAGAAQSEESMARWSANKGNVGSDDILVINAKDLKGLDYRMARCCNPVFGDDVFGFVTRTEGVKIHRMSCPNASRLLENYPYRIQRVRWADTPSAGSFQTTLKISASTDSSVINHLMEVTGMFKVSIRSFTVNRNDKSGTDDITMKISVPSNMELDKVMSQIKVMRGVIRLSRL